MDNNKKYALISVSDKTGIVPFAKAIADLGYSILSTGGTASLLREEGLCVTSVSDVTGFPECLDGRVKTLHPYIHGGLLALRDNPEHMKTLADFNIAPIDIAVINLYPFRKTIEKENTSFEDAIENIDIGGPAMLRAAAKNYSGVAVLTDPEDYDRVICELRETGSVSHETRLTLAYKVFAHTASYDALIADYLSKRTEVKIPEFPNTLTVPLELQSSLRYGENPHQSAAFYKEMVNVSGTLADAEQLHGKELSFNNISDTNGALELLREFNEPTVVAVKHANPCGVASADTLSKAWDMAYNADPVSIFGGIVAVNTVMDAQTAEKINSIFIEIVIAPDYTDEALSILTQKKNIRLLRLPSVECGVPGTGYDFKRVSGGFLVQNRDLKLLENELQVVSDRKPTESELRDMLFAWRIVKHVKSNAIALAKDSCSVGIGGGQVNRIWATQQAIEHGGDRVPGSAMASDAFFPFDDCVRAAAAAGITAIIHPGGSKNDQLSIDACNELGIAMVVTGMRHFKHS